MKTINWTTSNGQKVEVAVSSDFELNTQGRRKDSGYKTVVIKATVDGESVSTAGGIRPVQHPVIVSMLGEKLGLTPENNNAVVSAVETVKSEIAKHNEKLMQNELKLDQATSEGKQIENRMNY